MSSAGSSYDRRRTTVSGPLPHIDPGNHQGQGVNHGPNKLSPIKTMRFPWSSPSAPSSPTRLTQPATSGVAPASPVRLHGHKRNVSGNILARLNFLKDNTETATTSSSGDAEDVAHVAGSSISRKSLDDDSASAPSSARADGAMASAMGASKTRKRKGSLRKTALLGGRRLTSEGRERKNSLLQRPIHTKLSPVHPSSGESPQRASAASSEGQNPPHAKGVQDQSAEDNAQGQFGYEMAEAASSSDSGWSRPVAAGERLSLMTDRGARADALGLSGLASPVDLKSPTSQTSYASASTTDDDDVMTFRRPAKSFADGQREGITLQQPLSTAATSYFPQMPPEATLMRRRSSKQSRSSPLSRNMTTLANFPEPEPHDYTETEYWGWVILFVTWLTFTVGMGSCLEIWSWAWDVGRTPYAPPELEDDETLPIVGYYPALIVLTGVVAWVWITVAWVGMKYFRHAKIEV